MTSRDFPDGGFLEHKSIMTVDCRVFNFLRRSNGIWDEVRPPALKVALHLIYQLSVKLVNKPLQAAGI